MQVALEPSKNKLIPVNKRKYAPIWDAIKKNKHATIKCDYKDIYTIIQGVKKEKGKDDKRPRGFLLTTQLTDIKDPVTGVMSCGIEFKLIEDTSIRNL